MKWVIAVNYRSHFFRLTPTPWLSPTPRLSPTPWLTNAFLFIILLGFGVNPDFQSGVFINFLISQDLGSCDRMMTSPKILIYSLMLVFVHLTRWEEQQSTLAFGKLTFFCESFVDMTVAKIYNIDFIIQSPAGFTISV